MNKNLETNLSEGSVLKGILIFTIPFLISNVVQSLYNVADMLIVGNVAGAGAMSGVNIGGQVTFILTNTIVGLSLGATVLIGQYIGSNEREALKRVISTIITLLLLISVVLTPLMLLLRDLLLTAIQTPLPSFAESANYLSVTVTGIVFIFGYNALSAILRGMGNSKAPFFFVLIACAVNVFLDVLFVYNFGMRAFGAALATVISQALSVFLCILYMVKNKFLFDFKLSSFRIYKDQLRKILKIGVPTCVQNNIIGMSFLFLTAVINIIGGVTASAAVGAVAKFNSFVFMPTTAISASVAAMCAQNFGADRPDRAKQTCKIGIVMAVLVSYIFFAYTRLYPETIIRIFIKDQAVINEGADYLFSMSYDFLITPFVFCLNGLFIGGGHTMFTLVNSIVCSVLLRVPLSYFLGVTLNLGLKGAGLAIPLATLGSLAAILVFYFSGRWAVNSVKSGIIVETPS